MDYSAVSASDLDRLVLTREAIELEGLHSAMPKEADAYFRADRARPGVDPVTIPAGFAVALVTEGHGIVHAGKVSVEVQRGDAYLIPYSVGDWSLSGDLVAMIARPPAPDAPVAPR